MTTTDFISQVKIHFDRKTRTSTHPFSSHIRAYRLRKNTTNKKLWESRLTKEASLFLKTEEGALTCCASSKAGAVQGLASQVWRKIQDEEGAGEMELEEDDQEPGAASLVSKMERVSIKEEKDPFANQKALDVAQLTVHFIKKNYMTDTNLILDLYSGVLQYLSSLEPDEVFFVESDVGKIKSFEPYSARTSKTMCNAIMDKLVANGWVKKELGRNKNRPLLPCYSMGARG